MTPSSRSHSPAGTSLRPLGSGEISSEHEARLPEPRGAHRGPAFQYCVVACLPDGSKSKSLIVTDDEEQAIECFGSVNDMAPHLIVALYRYSCGADAVCILRVEPGPINPYPPSTPFDPRR